MLKPGPCCGGPAILKTWGEPNPESAVGCKYCGLRTKSLPDPGDVARLWNQRVK